MVDLRWSSSAWMASASMWRRHCTVRGTSSFTLSSCRKSIRAKLYIKLDADEAPRAKRSSPLFYCLFPSYKGKGKGFLNSLLSGSFLIKVFSFSSEKDRRTDSRIRRKKHSAAPPGIEPRILRILVARSNHWATKPKRVFFVWSGCQFFYRCRSWKTRVWLVKVSCLTPVAKQAKTAFFNRPTVWNVAHCWGSNPHLSLQKGCTNYFIHKTPRVQNLPISNSPLVFSVWEPQGASQL